MDLKWLAEKLKFYYGAPERPTTSNRVFLLIETILSQNTNDKNRDIAMDRLRERFDSPAEIMKADSEVIYKAIKVAGLGNIKSERIKKALRKIKAKKGEITLDFLDGMSLEEARNWLLELPGVGFKTASVVLNFGFQKNAFPVDTHCERVLKRLGVVEEKMKPADISEFMEGRLDNGEEYELHINLINHGRELCKAPGPLCEDCFLSERCRYFKEKR